MSAVFKDELIGKVYSFTLKNGISFAETTLVVGVSGGADSIALLHMLHHWPEPVSVHAVHVHHGLRGENADRDAAYVASLCEQWNIPLQEYRIDVHSVAEASGCGVEEAGRQERYRLFEETRCRSGANWIATAHTASDQTETVLMHLIRGCGADGLCGIPLLRHPIVRPLLCCTREEIEAYCSRHQLAYMTDETNADMQYTRNRIRCEVLPLLRQLNPSVDEAIRRLSSCVSEDSGLLCSVAGQVLEQAKCGNTTYRVDAFLDQPSPVCRRMILEMFRSASLRSYEEKHVLAVERALMLDSGAVTLPGGHVLRVEKGLVFFDVQAQLQVPAPLPVPMLPFTFDWSGTTYCLQLISPVSEVERQNVHKMFFKSCIDYAKIQGDLCVRARYIGDLLHPAGRCGGKSLKKLMNEWRLPVPLRNSYPLLCDDVGVLLVPGYTCDERVRVTPDTNHFLVFQPLLEQG